MRPSSFLCARTSRVMRDNRVLRAWSRFDVPADCSGGMVITSPAIAPAEPNSTSVDVRARDPAGSSCPASKSRTNHTATSSRRDERNDPRAAWTGGSPQQRGQQDAERDLRDRPWSAPGRARRRPSSTAYSYSGSSDTWSMRSRTCAGRSRRRTAASDRRPALRTRPRRQQRTTPEASARPAPAPAGRPNRTARRHRASRQPQRRASQTPSRHPHHRPGYQSRRLCVALQVFERISKPPATNTPPRGQPPRRRAASPAAAMHARRMPRSGAAATAVRIHPRPITASVRDRRRERHQDDLSVLHLVPDLARAQRRCRAAAHRDQPATVYSARTGPQPPQRRPEAARRRVRRAPPQPVDEPCRAAARRQARGSAPPACAMTSLCATLGDQERRSAATRA